MSDYTLLIDSVMGVSPGMVTLLPDLLQAIIDHSPPQSKIILLKRTEKKLSQPSSQLQVVEINPTGMKWTGKWRWYHRTLPALIEEHRANVFFSLSGILGPEILRTNCATINTVNNMLPFHSLRETFTRPLSLNALKILLLKRTYLWSCNHADALFFFSKYAKEKLAQEIGNVLTKSVVALNGRPSDIVMNHSYSVSPVPYFLYLSAINAYKNHHNLIKAYAHAHKQNPDLPPLYFAGAIVDFRYFQSLQRLIKKLKLTPYIKYQGILPREQLGPWMFQAQVNFFPSVCETNSLVLAETLGIGAVLACSDVGPMREIVAQAAEFFDPYHPLSIAQVMLDLNQMDQRRKQLRQLALKRNSELSWNDCGRALWVAAKMALHSHSSKNS